MKDHTATVVPAGFVIQQCPARIAYGARRPASRGSHNASNNPPRSFAVGRPAGSMFIEQSYDKRAYRALAATSTLNRKV